VPLHTNNPLGISMLDGFNARKGAAIGKPA
jgi:hypothetical protein